MISVKILVRTKFGQRVNQRRAPVWLAFFSRRAGLISRLRTVVGQRDRRSLWQLIRSERATIHNFMTVIPITASNRPAK
jgi:hypothetical protein